MSVDIEKLRAMHAATTQGRWLEGLEYGTLFCSGRAELLGVGHSHGYGQWGAFVNARDSEFVAAVHEAVIPLCDRVERAETEAERLRAENARLTNELAEVRDNYKVASESHVGCLYALYYAAAAEAKWPSPGRRNALLWMIAADCRIQVEYAAFYVKHPAFETVTHNADGCSNAADVLYQMVCAFSGREA